MEYAEKPKGKPLPWARRTLRNILLAMPWRLTVIALVATVYFGNLWAWQLHSRPVSNVAPKDFTMDVHNQLVFDNSEPATVWINSDCNFRVQGGESIELPKMVAPPPISSRSVNEGYYDLTFSATNGTFTVAYLDQNPSHCKADVRVTSTQPKAVVTARSEDWFSDLGKIGAFFWVAALTMVAMTIAAVIDEGINNWASKTPETS